MCKYCDSTCKTQKLKTSIVHLYFCLQVCVQQTALDMLDKGYDVHILADGCSSRSQVDRMLALEVRAFLLRVFIGGRERANLDFSIPFYPTVTATLLVKFYV